MPYAGWNALGMECLRRLRRLMLDRNMDDDVFRSQMKGKLAAAVWGRYVSYSSRR